MAIWTGTRRVAVIPAITTGAGNAPANFMQRVSDRIFFDPDPATGVDRSLRRYIHAVSYGRASLDAEVFSPVTVQWAVHGNPPVPNPGQTMTDAITAAGMGASAFQHVMVVFPAGIGGIASWAFWGGGQARSYMFLDSAIGAWGMELLHMVTEFKDLYGPPPGRSPSPGAYDEMDASAGTHPSVFTKLRMGWLDMSTTVRNVVPQQTGTSVVLHPLALLQPPPPGRVTAIKIQIGGSPDRYLLVEARESLDQYDGATPSLSSGIPGDGVVVYDVDESVWPPLWLRVNGGLKVGHVFSDSGSQSEVHVTDHIQGGGFRISVKATEPARCNTIRQELEVLADDIAVLQGDLKTAAPGDKSRIAARIKTLKGLVGALKQEAANLHCRM